MSSDQDHTSTQVNKNLISIHPCKSKNESSGIRTNGSWPGLDEYSLIPVSKVFLTEVSGKYKILVFENVSALEKVCQCRRGTLTRGGDC